MELAIHSSGICISDVFGVVLDCSAVAEGGIERVSAGREREGGSLLVRRGDLLFQTPRLQCMSTTAPDTSLTFTNVTITDSNI